MRTDETNPNDGFLLGRERLEAADAVRSARGVGRRGCREPAAATDKILTRPDFSFLLSKFLI